MVSRSRVTRPKKAYSTPKERELLLLLVNRYLDVIESKETTILESRRKMLAWEKISRIFNRSPSVETPATSRQLRKLWCNLKQKEKKRRREKRTILPQTESSLLASVTDAEDDKETVVSSFHITKNPVPFEYENTPSPESGEQAEGEAAAAGGKVGYEAAAESCEGYDSASAQMSELAGRVDRLRQNLRHRSARHRTDATHASRMAQEDYRHKCAMNGLLEEEQRLKNLLLRARLEEVSGEAGSLHGDET